MGTCVAGFRRNLANRGLTAAALIAVALIGFPSGTAAPNVESVTFKGLVHQPPPQRHTPPERSVAATVPSTTLPLPELDGSYVVATAKDGVPEVVAHTEAPAGAVRDPRISEQRFIWDVGNTPPRSVTAPELGPLPGVGRNIVGRIGTDTGWTFTNPNSYGVPPVFLVLEDQGAWLRVQVPVRPNGTSAWISAASVVLAPRSVRVEVAVGAAMLRVKDGDSVLLETPVVVGAAGSPTPTGRLYVTQHEKTANPRGGYGPLIVGLSGYSETLASLSGGAPGLALHGTNHPEYVGQHRSNGCVRVPNDALLKLAVLAPPGTVVDIWP